MKVYAVIGKSSQVVSELIYSKCPEGYIEMSEQRPTPEHIANELGEWFIPDKEDEE